MEKYYGKLKKQLSQIDELKKYSKPFTDEQREEFLIWCSVTENLIIEISGENSKKHKDFKAIRFYPLVSGSWVDANKAYRNGLVGASAFLKSNLQGDLYKYKPPTRKPKEVKPKEVVAFISASFDDGVDSIVEWFRQMARKLGIKTIWLKEEYESKPAEDKMKSHIRECDCFIQILTLGIKHGWLENEIAWADQSKAKDCMAIFVEKGMKANGLASRVADSLYFDRNDLGEVAPDVIAYLLNLKEIVSQKGR